MKLRILSNILIFLTATFVVASITLQLSHTGLAGISRQTFVLIFPFFLALLSKRTQRYPRIGVVMNLVALGLAYSGFHLVFAWASI